MAADENVLSFQQMRESETNRLCSEAYQRLRALYQPERKHAMTAAEAVGLDRRYQSVLSRSNVQLDAQSVRAWSDAQLALEQTEALRLLGSIEMRERFAQGDIDPDETLFAQIFESSDPDEYQIHARANVALIESERLARQTRSQMTHLHTEPLYTSERPIEASSADERKAHI